MNYAEAYITGIGQSQIGRKLTRHPLLLTVDAVKEACANRVLKVQTKCHARSALYALRDQWAAAPARLQPPQKRPDA